jgi:hypothetical protein
MRRFRMTLAAALLSIAAAPSNAATIIYNDFSDVSQLTINGDAAQSDAALRLTPAEVGQGGSAFSTSQLTLGVGASFSTYFQFQITDAGGDPLQIEGDGDGFGADGLVFVVQPTGNNVGSSGGGLGYAGIGQSLGIEFDTFDNGFQPEIDDPNGNHVGVDINGDLMSVTTALEPTRFNDGDIWNVWIDYNGSTDSLEVRWSLSNFRPGASQLSAIVDLETLIGGTQAFVGFTAATGSAFENHDILSWELRETFSPVGGPVVPEPTSLALAGFAGIGMAVGAIRRRRQQKSAAA